MSTLASLALSAGAGLMQGIGPQAGGAVGFQIAHVLLAYLNVGGGYLAVILALIGGLALMLKRAPTELMHDLFSSMPIATRGGGAGEPGQFVLSADAEFAFGDGGAASAASAPAGGVAKEAARKIEFKRPITLEKSARLKPQPEKPQRLQAADCRAARRAAGLSHPGRRRPCWSAAPARSNRSSLISASMAVWSRYSPDRSSRCSSSNPVPASK